MELPLRMSHTFFVSSRTQPNAVRTYIELHSDRYAGMDERQALKAAEVDINKDAYDAGYKDINYVEQYAKDRAFDVDEFGQLIEVVEDKNTKLLVLYLVAGSLLERYSQDISQLLKCDDPAVRRLLLMAPKNKKYREGMASAMIQSGHTKCTCIPLDKIIPRDDTVGDTAIIVLGTTKPSKSLVSNLIQKWKDKYGQWQEMCIAVYKADCLVAASIMRDKYCGNTFAGFKL